VSPTTQKHQQLILLEPMKAQSLDAVAKRLGVPKQVLLREAVDYLLAIHGIPYASPQLDQLRKSLAMCELRMNEVCRGKKTSVEEMHGACAEVLVRVSRALDELGEPARSFPKARNRGEHWTTKMRRNSGGKDSQQ